MSIVILIPARLASTRLPNKPLADIAGVPMVVRVAQRVQGLNIQAKTVRVVVAADSLGIIHACGDYGVAAVLTRSDHPSGSDRLAEACQLLGLDDDDIVVNVQGDEPLIDPELVLAVAELLAQTPGASMSTAAHAIDSYADYANPNVVKVVLDAQGIALYFSRAMIPFERDRANTLPKPPPLRHIGIYGYRVGFLRQFPQLPQAPHEVSESLEQLRAMWHGHRIAVHTASQAPGPGVDTPEDLERVRLLFLP
ncbi:3-deoxy-manno-octulosonate cytidylyltransferase [Rhodoferax sp. PAMC 29310]|uniref:3-deoxy-manno-octulosonate cytidylyltransferase n=1 Tax=Rhodoferax sp. PAMC 29310 TaxID=2822760 RepID=UPI001B31D26D|nr:3-deoxy-manno-octulosonate cytidylyltransferase [Rhodoferax sp. PAMC 29310]